ncbi:hypothetical protein [Paenibacillus ihbetae]|uniref:Uncharacterized protein n=1 Tax=Paenibacillus ihbetae TaxID=1870820 RepID=A0ABX3K3S4_9BACL|nr:hypothetical protein [Paenibacillus ihbetae]OOC64062.1 hypothetical protein BBD40_20660 [Paenibacillus ihbetae]
MLQISLFIESDSEQEVSEIINEVLPKLAELGSTYQVSSCEKYWKIETWYKAVIDVNTFNPITLDIANYMLKRLCNVWIWDNNKSSAHTNDRNDEVMYVHPKIRFINCWFEDLE